jgi:hypothetical protein
MRLPTVTLFHKKKNRNKIINQTDYARDISKWVSGGWEIVGHTRGDAPEAEVLAAARESDLNMARLKAEGKDAWRGDKERAFKARKVTLAGEVPTAPDESPASEASPPPGGSEAGTVSEDAPEETPVVDWRTMRWNEAAKWVRDMTGKYPRTKAMAEKYMEEYERIQGKLE